jgi:serine/threonine protein kinase
MTHRLILQKRNYIHNDLKPDNIIYCKDGFKIIDWELSRDIKSKPDSIIYTGNTRYNHPLKLYLKLSLA